VIAPAVGGGASGALTATFSPKPRGATQFIGTTGKFTYTSVSADSADFTVLFIATQLVLIRPIRTIRPDHDFTQGKPIAHRMRQTTPTDVVQHCGVFLKNSTIHGVVRFPDKLPQIRLLPTSFCAKPYANSICLQNPYKCQPPKIGGSGHGLPGIEVPTITGLISSKPFKTRFVRSARPSSPQLAAANGQLRAMPRNRPRPGTGITAIFPNKIN